MASALEHPERRRAAFFNPPHLMDLVEIVIAEQTDERTEEFAVDYVRDIERKMSSSGTRPASPPRDSASRWDSRRSDRGWGVASPADIDEGMEIGYGHPMGPSS